MSKRFPIWDEFEKELKITPEEEVLIKFERELIETEIKIRNEKEISQEKLSESSGIKQSALARLERGAHSPSINTLIKVLYPLGYTLKIVPIEKE